MEVVRTSTLVVCVKWHVCLSKRCRLKEHVFQFDNTQVSQKRWHTIQIPERRMHTKKVNIARHMD
jgi:hypothetical protein